MSLEIGMVFRCVTDELELAGIRRGDQCEVVALDRPAGHGVASGRLRNQRTGELIRGLWCPDCAPEAWRPVVHKRLQFAPSSRLASFGLALRAGNPVYLVDATGVVHSLSAQQYEELEHAPPGARVFTNEADAVSHARNVVSALRFVP